jgi:hypothetical protein
MRWPITRSNSFSGRVCSRLGLFPSSWKYKLHQAEILNAFPCTCSNQPLGAEAGVALAGNDDVVVHLDAQRFGGINDHFGHVNVGA